MGKSGGKGAVSKTIKYEDLTQTEPDFDDARYTSIMSRTGEKISFSVESRVLGPLVGTLGTTAFLHLIMGLTVLTAIWVSLAVVVALVAVVDKPKIGRKMMRALSKVR